MTLTNDEKDSLRACIEYTLKEADLDAAETQHLRELLQAIRYL